MCWSTLLPPAYEVRREVMFSQVCVCPQGGGSAPWSLVLSGGGGGGGKHIQGCSWGAPGQDRGPGGGCTPRQDKGAPDRTPQGGHAVRLLRSRRRTFLMFNIATELKPVLKRKYRIINLELTIKCLECQEKWTMASNVSVLSC